MWANFRVNSLSWSIAVQSREMPALFVTHSYRLFCEYACKLETSSERDFWNSSMAVLCIGIGILLAVVYTCFLLFRNLVICALSMDGSTMKIGTYLLALIEAENLHLTAL